MSDHITRNGRKYFEESYLRLANENTKRKAEQVAALQRELAELRVKLTREQFGGMCAAVLFYQDPKRLIERWLELGIEVED